MVSSAASCGATFFFAVCLLCPPRAISEAQAASPDAGSCCTVGTAFVAHRAGAAGAYALSRATTALPLCQRRVALAGRRAQPLCMGWGGMGDRSRRRAGAQVELHASGGKQPSETMSRSETSDEESDEVMSMMASTDVYRKEDKVRVFGANLDSKIASRGAGLQSYDEKEVSPALMAELLQKYAGDMDAAKRELRMRDMKTKEAEQFFRTGVKLMERGKYKMAIEEIGKAISAIPGGASSREGGQYTIWLGQAFDANGQRGKAVMTMRALKTHDDRDVRRVAGGIEYILTSPELKLNPKNYQSFDLEKLDQIKQGKKALQYSKMEKPPEKYSLEWYMLQKPPPPDEKKSAGSGSLAVAFSAITATALFFMSAGAGPS